MNGYNPMRYDCQKQGCFNLKRRPKIEVFADCFPRKIAMADIDGCVEINGRFLFLEWKTCGAPLGTGSKILLSHLSRLPGSVVIVAWGDAEYMVVEKAEIIFKGKFFTYPNATLNDVRQWMTRWGEIADNKRQVLVYDLVTTNNL